MDGQDLSNALKNETNINRSSPGTIAVTNTAVLLTFDDPEEFLINVSTPFLNPVKSFIKSVQTSGMNFPEMGNADSRACLNMHAAFTRKGINFFELVLKQGIEIPEGASEFDFWLWGNDSRYLLNAHFTHSGNQEQILKLADFTFLGWRRITVPLSGSIAVKEQKTRPVLTKFRVWSSDPAVVQECNFFIDSMNCNIFR